MRSLLRITALAAVVATATLAACGAADRIAAPEGAGPSLSYVFCPDSAGCTSLGGAYISHYTGANCTGTESYYTPYFFYDGVRRSWDGGGIAGNTLRTVTNVSYRDQWGTCYNAWPGGNTLSDFVTIYRTVCGESLCTAVQGAYISHFTGASCTGTESYYTPYFFYDGVRRSWDGNGIVGTTLRTVTNRSYKDSSGTCYNAWPSGNTLSDFVTVYR
jgi:hypothetical protein